MRFSITEHGLRAEVDTPPMRKVNIANPEFKHDEEDPPGFRAGIFRFGPLLEAKQMGASVYELPPGEAICPYHYEYAEEEWLLVLSGRPSVRHPEGTDELEPWDAVLFGTGPDGAHQVRNDSDEPARVLMFSTVFISKPAFSMDLSMADGHRLASAPGNTYLFMNRPQIRSSGRRPRRKPVHCSRNRPSSVSRSRTCS